MTKKKEDKFVWPFPSYTVVPIKRSTEADIDKVNLKVKRNEEKRNQKVSRDSVGDALL